MTDPQLPDAAAEDASRWVAWEVLDEPLVRAGLIVPVGIAIALAGLAGTVRRPVLFAILAVAGVLLVVGSFFRPVPTRLFGQGSDGEALWSTIIAALGPVLAGALLLVAVEVAVEPFAPLFALMLLMAAMLPLPGVRGPLLVWQIAAWLGLVLAAGQRAPLVLLLHLVGGVVFAVAAVRTADALTAGYAQAFTARVAAQRRAELLASLLRTHDLDPSVVLRSVADGLVGFGFDVAAIREVDREAGVARIIEGVARGELEVEEELPLTSPDLDLVLRTGAAVVLDADVREQTSRHDLGLRTALVFPVLEDDEVVALVAAGTVDGTLSDDATDAAELLVAQAGIALRRATAYRHDQATIDELRHLDRRTQDFISTVSHELRTPLTVVQGLGATLDERWDDLDVDRRADLLRRVDANAERLASMVTRLLDTSQLSRQALRLVDVEVRLAPLLRAALDRLDEVVAEYPVELAVAEDIAVRVDPELFEHVTDNLLLNLARHTPPGTPARLRAWQAGDRVVIELEDEGPGIDEQDLPHVLERFYRGGDESHRVSTRGLGLGLALAAEVVRAHGGRLSAGSGAAGGARFSFDVPRATPQ